MAGDRGYVFTFNFLDQVTREPSVVTIHSRDWQAARLAAHDARPAPRYRLMSSVQVPAAVWAARGASCVSS